MTKVLKEQIKNLKLQYKETKKELKKDYKETKKDFKKSYKSQKRNIKLSAVYDNTPLLDDKYSVLKEKYQKRLEKIQRKNEIRLLNEAPHLRVLEEIGNSITHGVGALLSILGLILLLLKSSTSMEIMGALFYSISLFLMMSSSCLYHAFSWGTKVKRIYRRFDYSSIYLLIGGTFSPILLVNIGNIYGIVWFCIMWLLIIIGITMVSIFGPGRLKWLHFPLYFLLGWSGLMLIPYWIKYTPMLFIFILLGGVIYTIGMIPFLKRGVKGAHFIWHFFVLFGAIIHFLGIYLYIY